MKSPLEQRESGFFFASPFSRPHFSQTLGLSSRDKCLFCSYCFSLRGGGRDGDGNRGAKSCHTQAEGAIVQNARRKDVVAQKSASAGFQPFFRSRKGTKVAFRDFEPKSPEVALPDPPRPFPDPSPTLLADPSRRPFRPFRPSPTFLRPFFLHPNGPNPVLITETMFGACRRTKTQVVGTKPTLHRVCDGICHENRPPQGFATESVVLRRLRQAWGGVLEDRRCTRGGGYLLRQGR